MSFRFRRAIRLSRHTRLNLSKTGIGLSAGVRGARVSAHSSGRITRTVGLPGTGIYWRKDSVARRSRGGTRHSSGTGLLRLLGGIGLNVMMNRVAANDEPAKAGWKDVLFVVALPVLVPFWITRWLWRRSGPGKYTVILGLVLLARLALLNS